MEKSYLFSSKNSRSRFQDGRAERYVSPCQISTTCFVQLNRGNLSASISCVNSFDSVAIFRAPLISYISRFGKEPDLCAAFVHATPVN